MLGSTDTHVFQSTYMYMARDSFMGGRGAWGHLPPPPLEFEKAKLLDVSVTSVKPQETLVVSLGKHDITNSKNRHL